MPEPDHVIERTDRSVTACICTDLDEKRIPLSEILTIDYILFNLLSSEPSLH